MEILFNNGMPSQNLLLYAACGDTFTANNDTAYIMLKTAGLRGTDGYNEQSMILINARNSIVLNSNEIKFSSKEGKLEGTWYINNNKLPLHDILTALKEIANVTYSDQTQGSTKDIIKACSAFKNIAII